MAAVEKLGGSKKRKRDLSLVKGGKKSDPKHRKKASSKPAKFQATSSEKPRKTLKAKSVKPAESEKSAAVWPKKKPMTPKERRLAAKELAETRKKKRKPHYSLEKELVSLWEKMRCYDIKKEDRSKLITQALQKMNGKFLDIAGSHVSARVLQTCVKYCSQAERDTVFDALGPHFLNLSRKKYAVHLVKKLLDTATKKQLEWFISSLHGHVASLLRHTVGSAVIEHVYHLANGSQKQSLLTELYSTELQLFKDLTLTNSGRLVDIISKLGLQKSSVLLHMTAVVQPLLEKGIVDYSIIHTALVEYFTIADKSSATDVIQQLIPLLVQESSAADESQPAPELPQKMKNKKKRLQLPLLVRMIRARDGLKVGILCVKHGSAKERKKIIKGMKGHSKKLALEQYGSLLLICILSVVDDTKLVTKIVIRELQAVLKELVVDKNGRRPFLQLLHPWCSRHLSPDDLACLNLSVPSLCEKDEEVEVLAEAGPDRESDIEMKASASDNDNSEICGTSMQLAMGGKKDPSVRRHELLLDSGLAESLIATCIENVGELLRSNFGKEVIYEVAAGGTDGVLESLADRVAALHEAIASLAALPKNEAEEHVFENFHSSRTIRKLILDSSTFAVTLWKTALEGKCEMWAQGHSCKVVTAFLESSDLKVKDLVKSEMQPLIDSGVLKVPENKLVEKED